MLGSPLPLDVVRRVGQALWMELGRPITADRLDWANSAIGPGAAEQLVAFLVRFGALENEGAQLEAAGLVEFLRELATERGAASNVPRVIWTLPPALADAGDSGGYLDAAIEVINAAQKSLWLVSPFVEARGMGRLLEPAVRALERGVRVRVVSHGTELASSSASAALEQLRRESVRIAGNLAVYGVVADAGLLVHSKVVLADGVTATLGSANLTNRGLTLNFEVGVLLRGEPARDLESMLCRLCETDLVALTFAT